MHGWTCIPLRARVGAAMDSLDHVSIQSCFHECSPNGKAREHTNVTLPLYGLLPTFLPSFEEFLSSFRPSVPGKQPLLCTYQF